MYGQQYLFRPVCPGSCPGHAQSCAPTEAALAQCTDALAGFQAVRHIHACKNFLSARQPSKSVLVQRCLGTLLKQVKIRCYATQFRKDPSYKGQHDGKHVTVTWRLSKATNTGGEGRTYLQLKHCDSAEQNSPSRAATSIPNKLQTVLR